MKEKLHPTLIELWIGIILWSALISGIGVWFCENRIAWFAGIAFGALTACTLAFYMTKSVSKLVDDLDAGRGDKVIRASAMIRLFIAAAAIAIACFVPFFNPIGTFLGILSMKFAAYSNGLIHAVTKRAHPYFKDKEYPPEPEEGEEVSVVGSADGSAEASEGDEAELTDATESEGDNSGVQNNELKA